VEILLHGGICLVGPRRLLLVLLVPLLHQQRCSHPPHFSSAVALLSVPSSLSLSGHRRGIGAYHRVPPSRCPPPGSALPAK
jgi:hypothetical protein